jgi:hypothetical protein
MKRILEELQATGVQQAKIERFLHSEPRKGQGTIRDQIAAQMTNQLLDALGQPGEQTGSDAKRLRERGAWRTYDQRSVE